MNFMQHIFQNTVPASLNNLSFPCIYIFFKKTRKCTWMYSKHRDVLANHGASSRWYEEEHKYNYNVSKSIHI